MTNENSTTVREAIKQIQEGKIGVYPTETAYGVAADALDEEAVKKVYKAKQRPRSKPLTTIVNNAEQVRRHAELTEEEGRLIEEIMPGALTLVVEKKDHVPDELNESFVFRIPGAEAARKLAEEGPITATSANISGGETSYVVENISDELLDKMDFVIDRGELKEGLTSTIAEVNNGEVVIHRRGPVSKQSLEEVLHNGDRN
ncbi:MAG: L-threonylcarbamoyladenylate synthase [Candidatus Nanohaloarchaea archaeon]